MQALGSYACSDFGDGRDDPWEGLAKSKIAVSRDCAIYCMTALPDEGAGAFLWGPDGRRMRNKFSDGGVVCVVHDPAEFVARLKGQVGPACANGVAYDGDVFEPAAAPARPNDVPFHKNARFAYQREFRIVTDLKCERVMHRERRDREMAARRRRRL